MTRHFPHIREHIFHISFAHPVKHIGKLINCWYARSGAGHSSFSFKNKLLPEIT
jgi:hypothetical protein